MREQRERGRGLDDTDRRGTTMGGGGRGGRRGMMTRPWPSTCPCHCEQPLAGGEARVLTAMGGQGNNQEDQGKTTARTSTMEGRNHIPSPLSSDRQGST